MFDAVAVESAPRTTTPVNVRVRSAGLNNGVQESDCPYTLSDYPHPRRCRKPTYRSNSHKRPTCPAYAGFSNNAISRLLA